MNLYRTLDEEYQQLARRPNPPAWQTELGDLNDLVATIRADRPDPSRSDTALLRLLTIGRDQPDALTVALCALAPALRTRTARAISDDYRTDALAELTFVLLDSPLDRPGLAHRLVNRAHNRVYKTARRVHERGVVRTVTITPHDPAWMGHCDASGRDVACIVTDELGGAAEVAALPPAVHRVALTLQHPTQRQGVGVVGDNGGSTMTGCPSPGRIMYSVGELAMKAMNSNAARISSAASRADGAFMGARSAASTAAESSTVSTRAVDGGLITVEQRPAGFYRSFEEVLSVVDAEARQLLGS
jgi:hypothetical protein